MAIRPVWVRAENMWDFQGRCKKEYVKWAAMFPKNTEAQNQKFGEIQTLMTTSLLRYRYSHCTVSWREADMGPSPAML